MAKLIGIIGGTIATFAIFLATIIIAVVLVIIPAGLASANTLACVDIAAGGDLDTILKTIRIVESTDNYNARAAGSSASGAYQFTDATWDRHAGYARAVLAPPNTQDEKAVLHVNTINARTGGKLELIGVNWYLGHTPTEDEWDAVPFRSAGNVLTPRQYQTKWLGVYNDLVRAADPDPDSVTSAPNPLNPPDTENPGDPDTENTDDEVTGNDCLTPLGEIQTPEGIVTEADTVVVGGIRVHRILAPNLTALLADAAADGLTFKGWGFRSNADQKRLRRQHCGPTSGYDPGDYTVRSSSCSPPTATPGNSMHEKGLAVDFTCNGARFAGTACERWARTPTTCPSGEAVPHRLNCYGLKNLPSEPWHYSTTGR